MKKLYLLFFALLTVTFLQAQDIITKTDRTEIKALVTEISDETIKYKLFEFKEGPVYNLKRAEVHKIVYSNGREELFSTLQSAPKITEATDASVGAKVNNLLGKIGEQPVSRTQTTAEKLNRTFIGVSFSRQLTFSEDSYDFESKPLFGFNVLLEKYIEPKQSSVPKAPSTGYGLASTNYFGYSETIGNETYTGSRHYVTGYLFKELSVKNIVTFGGLAGGGMCYTRGKADENNKVNAGESAGVFGGGAHLGLFAQRSLTMGASGKPSTLVRFGYDMFLMSNANGTLGANISISF